MNQVGRSLIPIFLALCICSCSRTAEEDDICNRLAEVKEVPFRSTDPISDPAYRELRDSGLRAAPCLIDRLTDTTPMKDPRQAPFYNGFVIGDLAMILLAELEQISLYEPLPEEYKSKAKTAGVYAYFEYVETPSNRAALRDWWGRRLAAKLSH